MVTTSGLYAIRVIAQMYSAQVILWRRSVDSSQFSFVNKETEVL